MIGGTLFHAGLRLTPRAMTPASKVMATGGRTIRPLASAYQDALADWKAKYGVPDARKPAVVDKEQEQKVVHAVRSAVNPTRIALSEHMTQRAARNIFNNIDLIVSDMAGTVVEEGGIVYETLQRVMNEDGLNVPDEAMHPWHGAKKEAVIEHFALQAGTKSGDLEAQIVRISDNFLKAIEEAYFKEDSSVRLIDPNLEAWMRNLQAAGVKVALDTGYPARIQEGLVKKLGFDHVVDGYISTYQVKEGRPFPYMIHQLMERLGIENVRRVAKVGDSVRDIEEGHNAGCGLVIGVTSGADTAEALLAAGADIIADVITDLPVPQKKMVPRIRGLPDLS